MEILPDKSARHAKGFLPRLIHEASLKIEKVLTENEPKAKFRRSQNEPKAKFRRSQNESKAKFRRSQSAKAFTDRFAAKGEYAPTGRHPFDKVCQAHGIEHRLIRPRHPEPRGMVERFNGRISEVLATTRLSSAVNIWADLTALCRPVQPRHPAEGPWAYHPDGGPQKLVR